MAPTRALIPHAGGALKQNGRCIEVVVLRHRGVVLKPKRVPKDAPIALSDLIERVARLKQLARTLRGVGRFGCESFTEDKSDLVRAAERLEDDIRRRGVA